MAYYSGVANSFADVRTALFNACVAEGWTQADADTLTKGAAVVRATISTTNTPTLGPGIILQGATGLSGGSLVNPSVTRPRFGRPHQTTNPETWPMEYYIHIFDDPDEVFLVANFNVDSYWFLAFGVSDNAAITGTGLWLSATSRTGHGQNSIGGAINITPDSGGTSAIPGSSSGAFFWQTVPNTSAQTNNDTIHANIDGVAWSGDAVGTLPINSFNAILPASTLISRLPSAWNSEAVLVPIQGYVWRASNKCSLVVDVRNARYTRVDNYTPGQIITLGSDQWKIYPFYKKNITARNGGGTIDHTGTFGWALRYDGP